MEGLSWYNKGYYLRGTASSSYAVWAYMVHVVLYSLHTTQRQYTEHTNTDTKHMHTHRKIKMGNEKKMVDKDHLMLSLLIKCQELWMEL